VRMISNAWHCAGHPCCLFGWVNPLEVHLPRLHDTCETFAIIEAALGSGTRFEAMLQEVVSLDKG